MKTELAARMRAVRRRKPDQTLDEFAQELGVSTKTLSNYELGKRVPDVDFLATFARATGTDLVTLINLRLQAAGFQPIAEPVRESRGVYVVEAGEDAAEYARQALLAVPDFPRPWCLAIMELAARSEISPAGVDRLIAFVTSQLEA